APLAAPSDRLADRRGGPPGPPSRSRGSDLLVRRLLSLLLLLRGVRRVVVHPFPAARLARPDSGGARRRARSRDPGWRRPASPVGSRDRYRSPRGSARGRDRLRREESRSPILQVRADLSAGLRDGAPEASEERRCRRDADERGAALLHAAHLRDVELAPSRAVRTAPGLDGKPRVR